MGPDVGEAGGRGRGLGRLLGSLPCGGVRGCGVAMGCEQLVLGAGHSQPAAARRASRFRAVEIAYGSGCDDCSASLRPSVPLAGLRYRTSPLRRKPSKVYPLADRACSHSSGARRFERTVRRISTWLTPCPSNSKTQRRDSYFPSAGRLFSQCGATPTPDAVIRRNCATSSLYASLTS